MKIVTCIYTGLFGTHLGGSPKLKVEFYHSLKSIAKTGRDIVCYTSEAEHAELSEYFQDTHNVTLKVQELTSHHAHNRINELKASGIPANEFRCYELMHFKMEWIRREASLASPDEYIYWIDAGLSSENLFPYRFFPNRNPVEYDYNRYNCTVFVEGFFDKVVAKTGDKLYFIKHLNWRRVIGGLFGGKAKHVIPFCEKYELQLQHTLANSQLLMEEDIFNIIVDPNDELYNVETFNSWYHEDSDIHDEMPNKVTFYTLFT